MAAWCLPRNLSNDFLEAIKDGRLNPERLMEMSSEERRTAFAEFVGADNAREVNAQFESKLLLKNQQAGMVNWAKKISGITEPVRRDIIDTINRLDRVLNPGEAEAFYEDLAAKKLGASVTAEEAREIFRLSQRAEQLRAEITAAGSGDYKAGWTAESGTAYGRARLDLRDKINSLKPEGSTISNALLNILNFPKSALTSVLHWSAPFVQGWGMISTKQWWQGLGKMFQYFASPEAYRDMEGWIVSHPDYGVAMDAKLGLTKLGDKLSVREEAIQSSLLEDANQWLSEKTGVPNLIKAWSRSFTGFLNYVRFSRYTDLLNAARLGGEDVSLGSQVSHDLAKVVNNFTGRGELGPGDKYASAGPLLNAVFFSPRKIVATFEMFNPVAYARLSPVARTVAVKQLIGSLAATGAVLTLAKVAGAQVNFDPRSADFAKINIGGEKLDMTGGNASYLRFLSRIATNQEINTHGKLIDLGSQPRGATRADVAVAFIRGKLSPIAATIADALYGKDPVGRPFNLTEKLRDELTPIVINSFIDFAANNPHDTAAIIPALSALLGVGLESPLPPMSETGLDIWGQPLAPFGASNWRADPVNQEFDRLNYTPGFPMNTIRGQKLDDAQFHQYVQLAGRMAHMRIEQLVQSPGWDAIPSATRLSVMKAAIRKSRDIAATSIMLQSQGSSHDIMKAATDAKMAALAPAQ